MKLRVFNILKKTKVEGPGVRYCIWVQGCSRHCKGCQAVHTWAHEGGFLLDVEDIISDIIKTAKIEVQDSQNTEISDLTHINLTSLAPLTPAQIQNSAHTSKDIDSFTIEGVTFLGGEPFEQAEALGEIAERVKKYGLSVLCFTGDKLEKLKNNPNNKKLLDNTDLLIDGEFIEELTDYSRPWCGSSNQRYHFLTDRYDEKIFEEYKNKVEININKNGTVFINGMGNFNDILQKVDLAQINK